MGVGYSISCIVISEGDYTINVLMEFMMAVPPLETRTTCTSFYLNEPISIPNWSSFPLCSKCYETNNRLTSMPSDLCGRYILRTKFLIDKKIRNRTRTAFAKKKAYFPFSNGKSFNFSLESNRIIDKNCSTGISRSSFVSK